MTLFLEAVDNNHNVDTTKIAQSLKTHKEENLGRLAAESTLRSLVTQLLNSGMSLEQVAQMMNLSTVEVRRLVGENF
jgi:response regulator of citrate/malate metabolism